ncbi:MAG: glycogen-debranching protein [Burkholderiaceae bacterium]|nr:glycogen-debranching protein [Burkholderiaceae bacterium]
MITLFSRLLALLLVALAGAAGAATVTPGGADQLGGQLNAAGTAVSFRVFSKHATRMEVYLYRQATGAAHVARYVMARPAGSELWQVSVPVATLRNLGFDIDPTHPAKPFTDIHYGYRAWGPNWPWAAGWTPGSSTGFITDVDTQGHRFNPNKLLLDPYALETSHDYLSGAVSPANTDATVYASGTGDRQRDSGPVAPKGLVAMPFGAGFAALDTGTAPARPVKDDIVYEAHVRGLTAGDASVGACRGTYAGAVAKIPQLLSLGINAIEFMPVHETDNEANDLDHAPTQRSSTSTRGDNYWGYMTISYFAPDRRYACDKRPGGPTREFAAMVKAFHDAGIKVVADVVYNHTAEGGTWSGSDPSKASLFSMRGLDNASYYLLTRSPGTATDRAYYYDITGTGNTLNTRLPRVQTLILDSLRYYRQAFGIDGFRFDLGIALVNTYDNDTNPNDPQRFYFDRLNPDTAFARVAAAFPGVFLSGEPWGLAPGGQGYQLGQMPPGFSEWNGGWRDTIRRAQNKYGVKDFDATRGRIASRIAGSSDLYGDAGDGRGRPWYSVNFLNVHDGFTLKDLYSCNGQNVTQPWPLGPSDGGTADEDQWDNLADPVLQRQQARTGMALLMLSAGVPIFNAGDEFLRALNCNNNPYNVDSAGNWLNWSLSTEQQNFRTFVQRMIAFRKAQPALRPDQFYQGSDGNGNFMAQLDWFGADKSYRTNSPDGSWWNATSWAPDAQGQNRTLAWRYDGSEYGGDVILVLYNAEPGFRNFTLPWTGPGRSTWCRVTDTAAWAEGAGQVDLAAGTCVGGENAGYGVNGRSLVVLVAR